MVVVVVSPLPLDLDVDQRSTVLLPVVAVDCRSVIDVMVSLRILSSAAVAYRVQLILQGEEISC